MINLTTFASDASDLRVMRRRANTGHDVGSAAEVFGGQLALLQVGDAQGVDASRGAYDWWPLAINGRPIGELRDDANGITIHVTYIAARNGRIFCK